MKSNEQVDLPVEFQYQVDFAVIKCLNVVLFGPHFGFLVSSTFFTAANEPI